MTTDLSDKPVRPETGWSQARRLRGRGAPRTWVPALDDPAAARTRGPGPESHIVRGED
ncbi:hypothetical protein [Streptomyces ziwulingensis]|uniref:Uncharacterized protein n=1 Tax=Streptomyces ziwulingensis TaxID=1045501 RepID=A0ABP9B5M1_9ACTN